VIHGDCVFVDEAGAILRRKYDTPVDEWDFLFLGCCIPSTATFFRRRIIDAGHLLDLNYRNCMDLEYYLRLSRLGYRFQYLPAALACFRWHQESTTQIHWQRMIDEGLRAQRAHIEERMIPSWFGNRLFLKAMQRSFRARRLLKRYQVHRRLW
jgi:hypothetical protein